MNIIKELCVLFVLLEVRRSFGKIQCMDQNNKPVDWFVIFKLPKLSLSNDQLSNGESFMYLTSETVDQGWTWSSIEIQNPNSPLGNTLRPYYANQSEGFWIMYNDQNPSSWIWVLHGGHTKGVIGADSSGGIWLVHSVPKYPPAASYGYGYPSTGYTNGQSALCMSLTPESLNEIGTALAYNDPVIYDQRIESKLQEIYPNLFAATKKPTVYSPWYSVIDLKTLGGASFKAFAKSKKFKKDLYELVANELQSDLLVESWQNVLIPLNSSCTSKFKVINIKEIKVENKNIKYSSKKDHSKWAVSTSLPWTCIGDINRAKHQEKRGGGTVCFKNDKLWNLYQQVVSDSDHC